MKKSLLVITIILIVLSIPITFAINPSSIKINYNDDNVPGGKYKITINKMSKKMTVKEYHSCIYEDCEPKKYKNTIKSTKEEYKKIKTLLNGNINKSYLVNALSLLALDEKVMNNSDSKNDLNGAGNVTDREFGNSYLNLLLNNK